MSFMHPGNIEVGRAPVAPVDVAPTVGRMTMAQTAEHVRVVDELTGAHLYDTTRNPHDFGYPGVSVSFSGAGLHDGMPVFTRSEHHHLVR